MFNASDYFATFPVWIWTLLIIWSLIWKGIALWKSARNNSQTWFIILLIVNTLGILEILYIFFFFNCCKPEKAKNKL